LEYSISFEKESFAKFSGIETINDDLNTSSFIIDLKLLIILKLKLDKKIIKIDKKTRVSKENFCLTVFLRKADLIAITKSSLLEAIALNIQSS
jgi:hypothetical protein